MYANQNTALEATYLNPHLANYILLALLGGLHPQANAAVVKVILSFC